MSAIPTKYDESTQMHQQAHPPAYADSQNLQPGYPINSPGFQQPGYNQYPLSTQPPHGMNVQGLQQYPGQGYPMVTPADANQSTNAIIGNEGRPVVKFTAAIVLSCFVIFCCGWICGLAAFIIAMVGQNNGEHGDLEGAKKMLKMSYCVSIAGIIVGIICIIILVALYATKSSY